MCEIEGQREVLIVAAYVDVHFFNVASRYPTLHRETGTRETTERQGILQVRNNMLEDTI
jgi:hypothetical protein